jgi:hypothetical protein
MPGYKIVGADLREYGPVGAEQIRQWITEGRVNSETKLQAEGGGEWKRLAEVPEFAAALPGTALSTCPSCGETFEDGFDSCWNCGTKRDGSRPKEWPAVEAEAQKEAEPCPKCGSSNVTPGKLLPVGQSASVMFRPEGAHFFVLRFLSGVVLTSDRSFACLDCGLVWDYLRPDELEDFITRHCRGSGEQSEAYVLLSEGVRLESQGDIDGALAKYTAVMEKFPATEAAKDAEFSIRNLKDKSG